MNIVLMLRYISSKKFKYPTHQIVFCTEDALKCINFEGSDRIDK